MSLRALMVVVAANFATVAMAAEGTVVAPDGTLIHYLEAGQGPAVVLVHGWSCDATYWNATIDALATDHRVVAIDLAGHGASGAGREHYTMEAFGQDVVAVMTTLDVRGAVLVGHSMGGTVIIAAAVAAPERVVGLIGIDTLNQVREQFTGEQADALLVSWSDDLPGHVRQFVTGMFPAGFDSVAIARVAGDMASAPPAVSKSAFREMFAYDQAAAAKRLRVPLRLINADTYPIDEAGWKEVGVDLGVTIIKGCGHFPMVTVPDEFHRLLRATVAELQG